MVQNNRRLTSFLIFLVLTISGFLISFKTLLSPLTFGEVDGYSRAIWAFNNYVNGTLLTLDKFGGAWLPLHPKILGFSILFIRDPRFGFRLISLLFCVASVVLIYIYTERIFKSEPKKRLVALLAAIIYLLSPLRLLLATQPLSEPISMFFFSLILVLCSAKKVKPLYLIIFINIACAIRFEFWFMVPFIWLILYIDKPKKRINYVIECLACLIFPFYWMMINYFVSRNFFEFFSIKYSNAHKDESEVVYYNLFLASKAWVNALQDQIGMVGCFLYIFAWKLLTEKRKLVLNKKYIFVLIPVYFLLLLILQVHWGTMEWLAPRYLFPVLIGIIPYISYGMVKFLEAIFMRIKKNSFIGWIFLGGFVLFCYGDILGVKNNIVNWKLKGSVEQKQDVWQLVEYFKSNKIESKEIFYVEEGKSWTWVMFVFLTQKYDIKIISLSEYFTRNFDPSTEVILTNLFLLDQNCRGKMEFINKTFMVCKF